MEKAQVKDRVCIKTYDTTEGGRVTIEFQVHYVIWGLVRVTPIRSRLESDPVIDTIKDGHRMWITTSALGWFPLEEM